MKRHQSLHPLSRDHHHALVEARKLSNAVAANNRQEIKQVAESFSSFWESDLQWHFSQEEQFVLPLLARHQSPGGDEIAETLNQHSEIRRMIGELNDRLMGQELIEAQQLAALGESIRRHIRFEENDLFPVIEASVPEEELRQMNEQLEQDRQQKGFGGCALPLKSQTIEV